MFSLCSNARCARRPSLTLGRLARRSLALGGGDSALAVLARSGRLGPSEGVFALWPDARRHPSLALG